MSRKEEALSLRKSLLWTPIVSVCLAAWVFGVQHSDYRSAVTLVQQGQFERAIVLLNDILLKTPNDARARNLIGIALSAAGRKTEANEEFKKLLALDPKFIPALKNLALNLLALGQTRDAKLYFEQALKLAPSDQTCHYGLAEIAFNERDFDRAMRHYQESGDLILREPASIVRYATTCLEGKQPVMAASLLEKIPVDADPNVQFQAGIVLEKLKMFSQAATRFLAARNGSSDPYQAAFNAVLMLIKSANYESAIQNAREMLLHDELFRFTSSIGTGIDREKNEFEPHRGHLERRKAELYNLLAVAYEKAGRVKEAYDALRTATHLDPANESNYLDLIMLCLGTSDYSLALQIADAGLSRIPSSHRLHLQRGAVLAMKGELGEAEKEFAEATRLSPESGLSPVAMGLVLIQMEKVSEAIDVLRRQQSRTPNDPYVLWFLGEALNRAGIKPDSEAEREAMSALEVSIRLNPSLSQPRALLGKILLRRGEVDRACEQLEKAVELDPDDLTATYQLAQALQKKGQTARARELFSKVEKAKIADRDLTRQNLLRILREQSK